MNKCMFSGRLAADPDLRYSQGENPMAIARSRMAINRIKRKNSDENTQNADFINLIAFGKTAEFFEKYAKKGVKFEVVTHVQTGSYTNKDGVKVYTTEFVVDEIEFAESKGNSSPADSQSAPAPSSGDGFMNIPDGIDEELPFK